MRERILRELMALIRFPTISAQPGARLAVRDCAAWLVRHMRGLGLQAAAVTHDGPPIVLGEWRRHPDRPTALIYGHYDVQPPDPIEAWTSPPFAPAIRGEHLYGRGASDDKGQLFVHLKAVEQHLRAAGDLPVNVRFLLDPEEEIGSPSLLRFVSSERDRIRADVAVVSDTRILGPDRPAITYALRGSLSMEVEMAGPPRDLHSGNYGGAVRNPLEALCRRLATLHDRDGRIAVPGFYDAVRSVAASERRYLAASGVSEAEAPSASTAAQWGEPGFTPAERSTIRPAIVITGLHGGYQGPGPKSVLPAHASAKLNVRLVPDQDPAEIDRRIRMQLTADDGDPVQVRVTTHAAARPVLVDTRQPAVRAAATAYESAFGRAPVFVRSGGTIPVVDLLSRALRVPTVLMGFALPDDGLHGPDERLHLPTFFRGIETSVRFLSELAVHDRRLSLPRG